MPVSTSSLTARLFDQFATRKPLRSGSLIVTVFGDSVTPRGGTVWLGSLIQILAPLGISHRLVRTAVFRLVQDGILINEQVGRRSYYRLTAAGRQQFDDATARIYAQPDQHWQGQWCLVLLAGVKAKHRSAVRQALSWLGFGQLGPETLAHPNPDRASLDRQLQALGAQDGTVILNARLAEGESAVGLQQLVAQGWDLAALAQSYADYLSLFEPIWESLDGGSELRDADAFYIRTFMIHEYRRVVLRDPALPNQLLPEHWNGHAAFELSRRLYRHVAPASERFIDHALENEDGQLPPAGKDFAARFGGLRDSLDGISG